MLPIFGIILLYKRKFIMITGIELLNKLRTEQTADDNFIKSCGYVTVQKSGKEKILFTQFYDELLNAKLNEPQ